MTASFGGCAQPADPDLTILGNLTLSANVLSMLGAADNAAICTAIGVGAAATPTFAGLSLSSGDVAGSGVDVAASGSAAIPNPGTLTNKTRLNYRGFGLTIDSAVLAAGPSFGIGVAINRAGPALGVKNATGQSINVEAGNLQLGSGVCAINTTTDGSYAGLFLGHNYTGNYYTQRNTSYPSWGIDLGGVDNVSYSGTNDTFNVVRQAAGAAHTARVSVFQLPNAVPANANQAALATTAATQTTPWGFASQGQADAIATLVNAMRQILVDRKLMKGSA